MSLFRNGCSVRAVPKATTTVPIVMTDFGDKLAAGDTVRAIEVTASTAYVSSILAAAGPSLVGARPRAETVPRLQSSRASIWAREQFRTKLWFRSMARARGYDSRFHMTCFAPSRSYRDQCPRSRNRQRPLASPGRTSLKQQESSPGSFRLSYAPGCSASQLHQRTLSLRTLSQGQPRVTSGVAAGRGSCRR